MDWTPWQNKVFNKLEQYGGDVTVRVATLSTFSPSSDSYSKASTDYVVKGLITNLRGRDENGTPIISEDVVILLAAKGLPELIDKETIRIISGTKTYQPITISVLRPGGTSLLYKIQAK
jgi:hypothetical protein